MDYSNDKIDAFVQHLNDKIDNIDTNLGLILGQTTEHNHRLTKVEEKLAIQKGFSQAMGIMIGVVIIPMLGWALYQLVTLDTRITTGVQSALNNYDIQIK